MKQLLLLALCVLCTACGTFPLGTVQPQAGKTPDQQQLDTLTCKDQAHLEASSGERQVGAFLLGMTIVGTPVAYAMDRQTQRDVFVACMTKRGYTVIPAKE